MDIRRIESFLSVAELGGFRSAAEALNRSQSAVSTHVRELEEELGVPLLNRTTRRMNLTPEGEIYLDHARKILSEIDELADRLLGTTAAPQGLLRVNATLGFGRSHIAPLLSEFCARYPQVDIQLQLSVNPPASTDDSYDVCFRFGNPPDSRSIARFIAPNRRLLVAAPSYLQKFGAPQTPEDLKRHNCIGIRQGDEAYGLWRFTREQGKGKKKSEESVSVKVRGNLTTNDGGIAVNWALEGHGILLRAEWDIQKYLQSGQLVQVLPACKSPDADIYAVYAERHRTSLRVKALVDFVASKFQTR